MATPVYKMTRAELVAELESFPMEVIGNVHDLRESVKIGRKIKESFETKPKPEVGYAAAVAGHKMHLEDIIDLYLSNLNGDETLFIGDWTVDISDSGQFTMTDGVTTFNGDKFLIMMNIDMKEVDDISLYNNETQGMTILYTKISV